MWVNDGAGHFRIASQGLPASGRLNCLATGDLDSDGTVDLALSSDYDVGYSQLMLYRNDGALRWSRLETTGLPDPYERGVASDTIRGVELVDFNGDGHLDLAAVNHPKAGVGIWMGDGAGGWHACGETGLPQEQAQIFGYGVTAADVNQDGKPDLAVAFGLAPNGSLQVWIQE